MLLQPWRRVQGFPLPRFTPLKGTTSTPLSRCLKPWRQPRGFLQAGLMMIPMLFNALQLLAADPDDEDETQEAVPLYDSPNPVTHRILQEAGQGRELFILLTALLQHGVPSLLRTAEVTLRS